MKGKDLIGAENSILHTISRNATLHEAISKLTDYKIGALLVSEGKTIYGIISERDILTICSRCKADDICKTSVGEVMTTNVIFADMEDDLVEIMETLRVNHIRHLPLKSEGNVVGMISLRDVNNAFINAISFENARLVEYISGKYMA